MTDARGPSDLAVWGSPPLFAEPVHVGRPNVGRGDALVARIEGVLERRWLSNDGPLVREFEAEVAHVAGVDHCVAVCNATVGLSLLAKACGLRGEVIVPSFTFVATAHALHWLGLEPRFCDIGRDHLVDPDQVERVVTPRTSAILGVHLWGRPCAAGALQDIADRHRLRLLFDAAHAIATTAGGRPVGSFGDAEVFSFHATKVVNAFEGGAIVTRDGDLARRLRRLRNFGFVDYDMVDGEGVNGKMHEASAAMGLTSLESLDEFVAVNRRNHRAWARALDQVPGLRMLRFDERERNTYQYAVAEVEPVDGLLTRDELVAVLWAENVLARRYFYPGCHAFEPYRTLFPDAASRLPTTEAVAAGVLVLPTGTATSVAMIDRIGEVLRTAQEAPHEVRRALSARGLPAWLSRRP